jgi:hypothetical protein
MVINLLFVPEYTWFFYLLLALCIGLLMHYLFEVRFVRRTIEDREAKVDDRPGKSFRGKPASLAWCDRYVAATQEMSDGSLLHHLDGAIFGKDQFFHHFESFTS